MDYFGWFLRLWSWKSGFLHEVWWGYELFNNVGLLLVFGFGIMVLLFGSWLGWSFRFLILKGCDDLEIGVCPNFDFGEYFWGKKFWSCGKGVWGLCKMISILQLHGIHRFEAYKADSSEVLCDSDVHCGDDDDDETGLFCDAEGCYDEELYWDCSEDGVVDVMALREMLKFERQHADAAVVELEKERLAVASAAEEAMAMILRLQNEKSLIVMEARNYKKMAELNMLYDRETMQKLRSLLLKNESERRVLESCSNR